MAILVKGEITITKGFKTWKEMVYAQDGKLKEHGIKFVFAKGRVIVWDSANIKIPKRVTVEVTREIFKENGWY